MALSTAQTKLLDSYSSQSGATILSLSAERPLLVVFLRHFGCTFCREAIAELETLRPQIEALGTGIAFVHLSTDAAAQKYFAPHGLDDVPRFADPQGLLYESLGLFRAQWHQYLNPKSIARMISAWGRGHFLGVPAGDIERMPGVFLFQSGTIRRSFRHKLVSDRPGYILLATPA